MKFTRQILIYTSTLFFFILANCSSKSKKFNKQQDLDKILKKYMDEGQVPGLVYLVAKNGKATLSNALGVADLRHGTPTQLNTVFELASVSKQFVAAAVLKLQEERKLSLDNTIEQYFPNHCRKFCTEITIRQLLSHTSGLPGWNHNWNQLEEAYGWQMEYSNDHWLSLLNDGLETSPGNKFIYSDLGFHLVGLIISKVAGMSTFEYLSYRFFEPLNMNTTYEDNEWQIIPNESNIYRLRNGELRSARRDWSQTTVGSGGILSTIDDLLKWNNSLNNQTILSEESIHLLFEHNFLNDGSPSFYGLGWEINETFGLKFQMHSGASGVKILRIPELDYFICILTNRQEAQDGAMEKILKFVLNEDFPKIEGRSLTVNYDQVKDYLGVYKFQSWDNGITTWNDGDSLVVKFKGDTLIIESNNLRNNLIDYEKDKFLTNEVDGYWRFERDENGDVIGLWWESYFYGDSFGVKIK